VKKDNKAEKAAILLQGVKTLTFKSFIH